MTNLRTALQWLMEHGLQSDAEVWVLSKPILEPVVAVESVGSDTWIGSAVVWQEPTPAPLTWEPFLSTLLSWYSAGGTFRWAQHPDFTYRGSYVVEPSSAVFLLFLPPSVELVESHAEVMEQRKEQAKRLTQEIEPQWDS